MFFIEAIQISGMWYEGNGIKENNTGSHDTDI